MLNSIFQLMNKYSISREQSIEIADSIYSNNLIIKYKYIPKQIGEKTNVLKFDEHFNWNIEMGTYTNMAMLHLHAWEPINYLLLGYHYTKNNKYLIKSNELIEDWYTHSLEANHKYLYYPHCVADRTLILGYLIELNNLSISYDIVNKLVDKHKEYLFSESNYVDYNHGTMLDRSLLLLAILLDDKSLFNFSLERLQNNIKNTFTKNMICKENSFTYAIFNLELIVSVQKYILDKINISLIDKFDTKINKALDFLDIVKKPDGKLPIYGDGELIDKNKLGSSILKKFYSTHSLFNEIIDFGYNLETHYFKNESYIIVKSNYFYLFIRTGDIIKNHKHADDLSIILYLGEDVFVDPGIYNYDKGEIRDYLKSSHAHNGVVLNNENYDYLKSNKKKIYIESVNEYEKFIHIVLVNNCYSYANITRNVYIIKQNNSIIIADNIYSPIKVSSSQTFNLSKHFKQNFVIDLKSRNNLIINNKFLLQSLSKGDLKLSYHKKNLYSEFFQKYEVIPKIEFVNVQSDVNQITYVGKANDNITLEAQGKNDKCISLILDDKNIYLPFKYNKIDINIEKYINIYKQNQVHYIEIHFSRFDNQQYAIYIYNSKNEKEAILWYQDSPVFKHKFVMNDKYRIRCFIKDKVSGEKSEFSMYKQINNSI
ncbi:heparinase II/III domain-containing protein [Lacicoccus qingdaonensis]|uniref:Heparinase II/III-like protein n=1 Tax=Lacicoccus qingdaonensis TaxID=576118 RepID=A0A1G9J8N1_9BACL|nr:heparinase II/III family protein [Salinicoccus qingdaonensis]SDL33583.1 Heparinase II/III-like protein [Salinicoccus qingdaonensis]